MSEWHRNWQDPEHAVEFDGWAAMDAENLGRMFDAFNDVRLLRARAPRTGTLVEVGCATGEFSRYLGNRLPGLRYVGLDISDVAITRAKQKYPQTTFQRVDPSTPLGQTWSAAGLTQAPEVIFAKDVIQHQPTPFEFLTSLVAEAGSMAIARCRTRDRGASVLDPEQSCQFYYADRVPYMVLNIDEIVAHVRRIAPTAELVIWRHHMILGGKYGRFLPRELYLKETGTAETAIGVFKQTDRPGQVTIEDRPDEQPNYTVGYALKHSARRALEGFRDCRRTATATVER